jgi:hypothetical protein
LQRKNIKQNRRHRSDPTGPGRNSPTPGKIETPCHITEITLVILKTAINVSQPLANDISTTWMAMRRLQ